ncbi:asparagine synthase-related protein, partial [Halobium palmae]
MELALLYSGGKDSSLVALLLDSFYDVRLVTAHFGVTGDWEHAERAAEALGYPFETVELDVDVAVGAVDRMREDGYPRNGIQRVHEHALEVVA